MIMVGKKNLLGFLLFEPLLIRDGYYAKSFSLIATNTSACVVMRGVVRILKNIKPLIDVPLDAFFLCSNRRVMVL